MNFWSVVEYTTVQDSTFSSSICYKNLFLLRNCFNIYLLYYPERWPLRKSCRHEKFFALWWQKEDCKNVDDLQWFHNGLQTKHITMNVDLPYKDRNCSNRLLATKNWNCFYSLNLFNKLSLFYSELPDFCETLKLCCQEGTNQFVMCQCVTVVPWVALPHLSKNVMSFILRLNRPDPPSPCMGFLNNPKC